MPGGRDPLVHLERMRREIDDLFDDVWARAGFPRRQRAGFRPRVDVYYCGDRGKPTKAVVIAELPGIEVGDVSLEVRGRTLIVSGERVPRDTEGRVYQQVEIEHGRFSREIALGADVDAQQARATYENGMLRIELPLLGQKGGTAAAKQGMAAERAEGEMERET
jgi:HSP20 family protein